MSTTLSENSISGDLLIFEAIMSRAYPNYRRMKPENLLKRMVKDGVLQIETLVEQAISKRGKLPRQSTEGRDFVDGTDAKKALTQLAIEPGKTTRRVAQISNIKGKHGALRIAVGETLTRKIYYFKVPKKAYDGLTCIRIYFNEDGSPKLDGKWFAYQCSFDELCQ